MEETNSDIYPFSVGPNNSSAKYKNLDPEKRTITSKIKFDPTASYYDMSGTKYLVIFNHYTYKASRYYRNRVPTPRRGTEKDVIRLNELFGDQLGFDVTVHNDKEYSEIWEILGELYRQDHSSTSCLCIAILTHGSTNGALYAADRTYELRDVVRRFENHSTLVNKPRLFFIQACRGSEVDPGVVCKDGDMGEYTFVTPSHADFLIMRSTVEEYKSFRDIRGSWLIQELCNVIEKHHPELDLLQMITLVHQKVAYNYITYTPSDPVSHDKKQVPETKFTLTKLLKL